MCNYAFLPLCCPSHPSSNVHFSFSPQMPENKWLFTADDCNLAGRLCSWSKEKHFYNCELDI